MGLYQFQPDPATERYPLALISPSSERTISSTLGELPRPDVKLLMHPDDAQERGLADGDLVRMFNDLGEVHCPLSVVPSIRRGTVSLPKGLWRRSTRNNTTGTALVPDTLTDLGGGACFNDARVKWWRWRIAEKEQEIDAAALGPLEQVLLRARALKTLVRSRSHLLISY